MIEEYCQNCRKVTGHKRAVGMGTFLVACLTLGMSLIVTPFYPKRCVVCGCKSESTWKTDRSTKPVSEEDLKKFTAKFLPDSVETEGLEKDRVSKLAYNFLCFITGQWRMMK